MKISVNDRTWTYEVQDECVIVISPKKKKITIEIEKVSKKGIFNLTIEAEDDGLRKARDLQESSEEDHGQKRNCLD